MIRRAWVFRWAISQMCTAGAGVALALAALAPAAHAQTDLQDRLAAFKAAQGQCSRAAQLHPSRDDADRAQRRGEVHRVLTATAKEVVVTITDSNFAKAVA
jgi:hypothetical protein